MRTVEDGDAVSVTVRDLPYGVREGDEAGAKDDQPRFSSFHERPRFPRIDVDPVIIVRKIEVLQPEQLPETQVGDSRIPTLHRRDGEYLVSRRGQGEEHPHISRVTRKRADIRIPGAE